MAIKKPKPEEKKEIKKLNDDITEAKKLLTEIDTNLSDLSTEHGVIRAEGTLLCRVRTLTLTPCGGWYSGAMSTSRGSNGMLPPGARERTGCR